MPGAAVSHDRENWDSGFSALIEQMPIAMAVFDRRMNYLAVTQLWRQAYGHPEADLVGRNYYQAHPATPPEWRRLHQEILLRGEIRRGEDSWAKSDGSRHWVKWSARPWQDGRGACRGLIVVAEDITEHKREQAERERARSAAERAGALLNEAIRSIPQGFVIYDPDDRLLLCNDTYLDCYARSRDLIVPGASFEAIVRQGAERGQYPQADGRLDAWVEARVATHRRADGKPFEQQLDDGRWLLVMEFRTPSGCIVGNRIDITERKQVEARLRRSAAVIDSLQEGIVITDRNAVILEANPAFSRITEYPADELRGRPMRILQSGRHDRSFYRQIWDCLTATGSWQGEIWNRRKSGEIYLEWMSISAIYDARGQVTNYVGISTDLSRMQHAQTELERLAHHDPLTKLPNRRLLMSRLEHAVERCRRHAANGAVLFIDLDRFKPVNDTYGHKAGDEVLRLATRRMRDRLRESDTLARLGGDEFVVVLEEISDPSHAALVASELIAQFGSPFELSNGRAVEVGASIGIALFPENGNGAERLVELADQALYEAKRHGRGAYRFWHERCAAEACSA